MVLSIYFPRHFARVLTSSEGAFVALDVSLLLRHVNYRSAAIGVWPEPTHLALAVCHILPDSGGPDVPHVQSDFVIVLTGVAPHVFDL